MSSTFECPVIKIKLEPHPNADTLSIVKIGGYQCVTKTAEWSEGQIAVFIPPDSVVPERPEWAWLGNEPRHRRIKVRKFRGEWSQGCIIAAMDGLSIGDNAAELMGIIPYEPPSSGREGMSAREYRSLPWYRRIIAYYKELRERPRGQYPHYDVENFRKFDSLFELGEPIIVTEKIHGANALYTSTKPWFKFWSSNPKVFMRSRTMWKHPFKRDWWQDAYRNTPGLARLLRDFPGISLYGEVYGRGVQKLTYGVTTPHFVGFDIWEQSKGWWEQGLAMDLMYDYNVPTVPRLFLGPYEGPRQLNGILERETYSCLARLNNRAVQLEDPKQISEGIVIQSLRTRKVLKIVSDKYLEKAE